MSRLSLPENREGRGGVVVDPGSDSSSGFVRGRELVRDRSATAHRNAMWQRVTGEGGVVVAAHTNRGTRRTSEVLEIASATIPPGSGCR